MNQDYNRDDDYQQQQRQDQEMDIDHQDRDDYHHDMDDNDEDDDAAAAIRYIDGDGFPPQAPVNSAPSLPCPPAMDYQVGDGGQMYVKMVDPAHPDQTIPIIAPVKGFKFVRSTPSRTYCPTSTELCH